MGAKASRFSRVVQQLVRFYRIGLWQVPTETLGWGYRLLISFARRVVLAVRCFERQQLTNRASALTYSTLFSTVPLMVILFVIAKGFGLEVFIEDRIRAALPGDPRVADTVIGFVMSYLDHARSGFFVGMGILVLLYTLLSLANNIERTFNQIWQVDRERTAFRKMTDYTAMLFLLPLFAIVTSGLSIFVSSFLNRLRGVIIISDTLSFLIELLPFVLMVAAFTGLYVFMPNTHVRWRSALVGGVPAGIAFQAVQYVHIHSQIWMASYNAIYGSFAALPLFMLWLQISWYICLVGATLSYVDQNIGYFYRGSDTLRVSRYQYDFLCLQVMQEICRRFRSGEAYATTDEIAQQKHIPIRLVTEMVQHLCRAGLLVEVVNGDRKEAGAAYVPARGVEGITVARVLTALSAEGEHIDEMKEPASAAWATYNQMCHDMMCVAQAQERVADFGQQPSEPNQQKDNEPCEKIES